MFVDTNWELCGLSLKNELDVSVLMFTELKINIWRGVIETNSSWSGGNTKNSHGSYKPAHTLIVIFTAIKCQHDEIAARSAAVLKPTPSK